MIWTVSKEKKNEERGDFSFLGKTKKRCFFGNRFFPLLIVLAFATGGIALFNFIYSEHSEENHPYTEFKTKLEQVCKDPLLPMPAYNGVESFFKFVTKPNTTHCYSWLEFGGEKIPIATQEEKNCMDEIRKTKMICFNEEYEMTKDPCLVYSFTKDADQQFERDMHMFSCEVHVFDGKQIEGAEHVRRTEFWLEHAWDIAEFPYDKPLDESEKSKSSNGIIRRRSLDFITHTLGHEGKKINFLKSDHEGREWILMKQIISHHDIVDVQQLGIRIHIPTYVNTMTGTGRHEYFRDLFEVFQGLSCLGYKYILGRPAKYYKGVVKIPEINKSYFVAYELNFAKVLKNNS